MISEHNNSFLVTILLATIAVIAALYFLGSGLHLGAWFGPFGGGD